MSELKQEANVVPALAIAPPAKPTIKPGRSAILIAMNPARIGSMKLNGCLKECCHWCVHTKVRWIDRIII